MANLPERFSNLPLYAFPRLRALLDHLEPGGPVTHMTIGEPRHAFPAWVRDVIADASDEFAKYPPNEGTPELRNAITAWLNGRYGVTVDAETQVMALNGTREGLFNAVLALCPEQKNGQQPVVLMPNPFYQVYMIGAMQAGTEPYFVNATAETGHLPDFASVDPAVLDRTALVFVCSPANPQGAIASRAYWTELFRLAEKHDFRILADECYSEIYRNEAPVGALQVAQEIGADPERVVIFHSLSKRSNLPGLRSGFVVSGPECMVRIKQLRAYSGAPLPLPIQRVSERVWADEAHVETSRALYQEKFKAADQVFAGLDGYLPPEAGFFLWLPVEDGEQAALRLWTETGVRVLPGAYLSRDTRAGNPGAGYIRVAMVAPIKEMQSALITLRDCLYG
jgi:aspartate/methionine/tyrosine aminotransferase